MYHRLILQTPDGKTFIRYLRKNVRIFAEVLQTDTKNQETIISLLQDKTNNKEVEK